MFSCRSCRRTTTLLHPARRATCRPSVRPGSPPKKTKTRWPTKVANAPGCHGDGRSEGGSLLQTVTCFLLVSRSQVEAGHVVQRGDRHSDKQHRRIREGNFCPGRSSDSSLCLLFTSGVFVFRAGASTTPQRLFLRCPKRRGRIFTALWLRASTGRCSPSTGESCECTTTETTSASESARKRSLTALCCCVRSASDLRSSLPQVYS